MFFDRSCFGNNRLLLIVDSFAVSFVGNAIAAYVAVRMGWFNVTVAVWFGVPIAMLEALTIVGIWWNKY